jgi:tetratricopeptide (TPR) repeat protein
MNLMTTAAELGHTTDVAARPQALGAFPLPLGYLLIPAGTENDAVRSALLNGTEPTVWPDGLRALELAHSGDVEAALGQLTTDDPVARYNRFVLQPEGVDTEKLRADLGEFGLLVDLVLFTIGERDTPPDVGGATGELAALALSAQASHAVAQGDPAAAVALLERAAQAAAEVSSCLEGVLVGAAGSICRDIDEASAQQAQPRLERALRLLDGADGLRVARAELHLAVATLIHERAQDNPGLLAQVIPHYHSALQLVLREEAPLLWASAHANLATAYLTMPMVEASGQLRLGVAAQSLRSALKVYTPEQYPEQWASVQLNLANSLVYTPSKHQADNLVEAVELYEGVLAARDRETDPLGRARVLANQGNALAHLGMFDQAKAKLYEARFLFEEQQDHDSVRAVRGVLDEIARQVALSRSEDLT